jgi:hypothetical protein
MRAGMPEAVAAREQLVHGLVAQLEQAVHVEVLAAGQQRQLDDAPPARAGRATARATTPTPACSWLMCLGRHLERGQRLAQVGCNQRGEPKPTRALPGASARARSQTMKV